MTNAWYHSKTDDLKLCAHAARGLARASIFNIAYDTPHKISFRMSGRSSLYDLWFSQTLQHKFYISLYLLWIYVLIFVLKNANFKVLYISLL